MICESVVFCEGYFDRAFWKGWLEHLGCTNLFGKQGRVIDPWRCNVGSGQYGFMSPGQTFVRVVPCGGKGHVLDQVRIRLEQRATKCIRRVVVNWDADTIDSAFRDGASPKATVGEIIGKLKPGATPDASGDYLIHLPEDELPTTLSLVLWETPDEPATGLPTKQTLERLCCAAICEVYPQRGLCVGPWLESLVEGPPLIPKSFSWSYMAGWYPDHNCEAFFELLWKDAAVAAALRKRLEHIGAWRVAKALIE